MLKLLSRNAPPSVSAALAAVQKSPELLSREARVAELRAQRAPLQQRRSQIYDRLQFANPIRPLFSDERARLQHEQQDLERELDALASEEATLTREIIAAMPVHASAIATALNDIRASAAREVLDSLDRYEAAAAVLAEASAAVTAAGGRALALPDWPFTPVTRAAQRIIDETRQLKKDAAK